MRGAARGRREIMCGGSGAPQQTHLSASEHDAFCTARNKLCDALDKIGASACFKFVSPQLMLATV